MDNKSKNKHKSHKATFIDSEDMKMAQIECQIPDFSEMSDSDSENVAMQMEFAARRIKEISSEMITAKNEDISKLWHERYCLVDKLSKKIEQMKSIENNIP